MSRKDYVATAEILNGIMNYLHPAVYSNIVNNFADMFAKDNSLFDKERFVNASYKVVA